MDPLLARAFKGNNESALYFPTNMHPNNRHQTNFETWLTPDPRDCISYLHYLPVTSTPII